MERSYRNMPKNLPKGKEYLAKWVEEVSLASAKDLHDEGLDINDVGEGGEKISLNALEYFK
jgi:hypothetical protein